MELSEPIKFMRRKTFLIFFCLSILITNLKGNCTEEIPPCLSIKSIFDRKCYKSLCIRDSNFTNIYEKLKNNVFGQDIGISSMRDIFKYKLTENNKREPISIHIVGNDKD